MTAYAHQKMSVALPDHIRATVNSMELVGMTQQKVAVKNKLPKDKVEPWIRAKLRAKQFPTEAIEAICSGLRSAEMFEESDSHFCHTQDGVSNLYQYRLWAQGKEDHMEVALICSNASFATARVIRRFQPTVEPIMESYTDYMTVTESGIFGDYKVTKEQTRQRQNGVRIVYTPIFRQDVMSADHMEAVKTFLEWECCESALEMQ
jgi:hypothetical protein